MRRRLIVCLAVLCVLATISGCATRAPAASSAFSYACAAGGDCGAFLTINNAEGQADKLLSAKSDVSSRVELHTVVKDNSGMMKMQQVESIPVPASGTVELKPGAFHVMLFGTNRELKVGDTYKLTLKYENGGESTVNVQVKEKN